MNLIDVPIEDHTYGFMDQYKKCWADHKKHSNHCGQPATDPLGLCADCHEEITGAQRRP